MWPAKRSKVILHVIQLQHDFVAPFYKKHIIIYYVSYYPHG